MRSQDSKNFELHSRICTWIHEFLDFFGFSQTAEAFALEQKQRQTAKHPWREAIANKADKDVIKELLVSFVADCEPDAFWTMWRKHVSLEARRGDGLELEFWIHVYFAAIGAKSDACLDSMLPTAGMKCLRIFLELNAAQLAARMETLNFFAFPYVTDPQMHPVFQQVYTEEWKSDLMDRLDKFLEYLPDKESYPTLCTLAGMGELTVINKRQHNTPGKKSIEATSSNEIKGNSMDGQREMPDESDDPAPEAHKIASCAIQDQDDASSPEKEEGSFNNLFEKLQREDLLVIENSVDWNLKNSTERPPAPLNAETDSLDYAAIKKTLKTGSDELVQSLLKALRLRISKSPLSKYGAADLHRFSECDLLNLHTDSSIIEDLLSRSVIPLTLELFHFLQKLSKQPQGRDYLAQQNNIVEILFAALTATADHEPSETETDDILISQNLQKIVLSCLSSMSLHKSCSERMNQIGVLSWLVDALSSLQAPIHGIDIAIALVGAPEGEAASAKKLEKLLKLCESCIGNDNPKIQAKGRSLLQALKQWPSFKRAATTETSVSEPIRDTQVSFKGHTQATEETTSSNEQSNQPFKLSYPDDEQDEVETLIESMNNEEGIDDKLLEEFYLPKPPASHAMNSEFDLDTAEDPSHMTGPLQPSMNIPTANDHVGAKSNSRSASKERISTSNNTFPRLRHPRSLSANSSTARSLRTMSTGVNTAECLNRKYAIPSLHSKTDTVKNPSPRRCLSGREKDLREDYKLAFSARREIPRTPNIRQ